MARKTIEVQQIKDLVNFQLRNSTCATPDRRQGAIDILEAVLHYTGNYKGFRYLGSPDLPEGITPGIRCSSKNNFADTDPTRIHYY
jgi:hypothetical protein